MKIKLPDDVMAYVTEDTVAYCVQADGFEKLIGYESTSVSWVHKDYRIQPKKSKKNSRNKK